VKYNLAAPTQCYEMTPADAHFYYDSYTIVSAPAGNCDVSDCVSQDWLEIVPPCPGSAASARVASAAPTPCDLKVTITGASSLTSGLVWDGTEPAFNAGDKCLSGCEDLLITVTDPSNHNRPVPNAVVSASVTGVGDKYLKPNTTGYFCSVIQPNRCGTPRYITGLRTNTSGRLALTYWAPGIVSKQGATITVRASEPCSQSACPRKKKTGTADKKVTVMPNIIYQAEATLDESEVKALAKWAESKILELAIHHSIEEILDHSLSALALAEKLAEETADKIGEGAERVSGVIEVADLINGLRLEYGFMALFLDKFKLSGIGLGRPREQPTVDGAPSSLLIGDLAADGTPPLHLGAKGLMYRYGEHLGFLEEEHELHPQQIHLYVYEVSDCRQGGDCAPEYLGRTGIEPALYIELESTDTAGEQSFRQAFEIPYNAHAWMLTQKGLAVH
jgi:hypothetical protein